MKEGRIYNFSPGPAILPEEVLETVRGNLLNYNKTGIGVMEMSHRGKEFEEINATAEATLRELLNISNDYAVAFMGGGATLQFAAVPLNLLGDNKTADYIVTGAWAEKAYEEALKYGTIKVAASSKDKKYSYIPEKLNLSANPAYVHFTSNNTIYGTQFSKEPEVGKNVLVCDASSDFLWKKVDINKYGLIYAGAQKNLGPAGVTVVVIRKDLLERHKEAWLPVMLNYKTFTDNKSLYNTPPAMPIYVMGEVFKWIKKEGGLAAVETRNRRKAKVVYDTVDAHPEMYEAVAEKSARSTMNVVFRFRSEDLEKKFLKEAQAKGFDGLKGHRSVGGLRASIYNSFPEEGCKALAAFMEEFAKSNG